MGFTTQSLGAVLQTLARVSRGEEAAVIEELLSAGRVDVGGDRVATVPASVAQIDTYLGTTQDFIPLTPGYADIYQGSLSVPYYLATAVRPEPGSGSGAADPDPGAVTTDAAPLDAFWNARYPYAVREGTDDERNLTRFNTLPQLRSVEAIPLVVTVPSEGEGPWPVVIFQHGFTRSRVDVLGVAESFGFNGYAVVAIDLPLHGADDTLFSDFFLGYEGDLRERTFGLDLQINATEEDGSDGIADESGAHFLNLSNLLVARDNLRQSVSDLLHLYSALDQIDVDGGGPDLDATRVAYVGQSLGSIVGTTFLSLVDVEAAFLSVPGGGVAKLIEGSETYSDVLIDGLADEGTLFGTPDYEAFLFAAQTVIDAGDPINYAARLTARGTPIHLSEVIGGRKFGPDDVVPNAVAGAPLSGTEPLARALGLESIFASTMANPVRGIVRFTAGGHGSLLDLDISVDAFIEMQNQMMEFVTTQGTSVTILNESVVLTAPN